MREFLTILAALLVAVLTAALAVPPFVDWSAHRDWMEACIGQALDARVSIEGAAEVRLLPAPRMRVGQLRLARPGFALAAREAEFELSPTDLLRGHLHFAEARFGSASIAVDPASLAAPAAGADRVAVERLVVRDGALRIDGPSPLALSGLDLDARIESLAGPFRGEGLLRAATGARRFQFLAGAVEDGSLRVKFALEGTDEAPRVELDGALRWADGAPAFEGAGVASGTLAAFALKPAPWRAAFAGRGTPDAFTADKLDLRLGDETRPLAANGAGAFSFSRGASARLAARMLDLDRFLAEYGRPAPALARAVATPVLLDLAADGVTLGGETIAEPAVHMEGAGHAPAVRASALLPGRTRFVYEGALDPARNFALSGRIDTQTRDARALARWLDPLAPALARALALAPSGALALAGRIETSPDRVALRDANATLDRSRFAGEAEWRGPRDGARATLAAKVHSPALDIDGLPDLATLKELSHEDFTLDFSAQAVRVARVGAASADAGRIAARIARRGDTIAIENFAIADLGGAALTGSAAFGPQGGRAEARLDADRLTDLAALARRVWPGHATEALAARAFALSPARLTFRLESEGSSVRAGAQGQAGGARFDLSLAPAGDGARLALAARIEAPDAAILMRQAGVPVIPLKGVGAGRASVQASGAAGAPWSTRAQLALAGLEADFSGVAQWSGDGLSGEGALNARSADLAPIMQILAFGAPQDAVPLAASARLKFTPADVAFQAARATVAGATAEGALARKAGDAWRGDLAFDRLSAPFLSSLVFGPPQPARAGARWSALKFAPPLFDPPDAELRVSAARLDLGAGEAENARAQLRLGPGLLEARDATATYAGAPVGGALTLRRDGGVASLRARVETGPLAVDSPPFALRARMRMEAAGAGASMAELVASLGGSGKAWFSDAAIARAAPQALAQALSEIEREETTFEPSRVGRALARGFDAGPQKIGAGEADVGLAAGRLSFAPVQLDFGGTQAKISGSLDLRAFTLDIREQIETVAPRDWEGAPPVVALAWRGPFAAPVRAIESEQLTAALVERAIVRESARNAALEADIRERAFFNRRLKFDRWLEEERHAEEARIAQEERRKAEEEARRKAEEDARRRAEDEARLREETKKEEARREDARKEEIRRKAEDALKAHQRPAHETPAERPRERSDRTGKPPAAFLPAGRDAAPDPSTAGRY